MASNGVVDARTNPNDPSQRVELFGNGRIDTFNTPPITDGPGDWFTRLDLPVAVAIHIVNWTTMAGYVLDKNGGFHRFGGAPDIATSKPDWYDGPNVIVQGVPYWPSGIYVDWSWNPFVPGRGVVLDGYGTLHPFGGAPGPARALHRWPYLAARKLVMSWAPDMRAYTLDYAGGIHHDYGAAPVKPFDGNRWFTGPVQAGDAPYWLRSDFARDLVITDWSNNPKGYTLDMVGRVHHWGGAEPAVGYPRGISGDWARKLIILNPDDPLRFLLVGHFAQWHEWVASTPPLVQAGGLGQSPAATVANTTRPVFEWGYTDAQRDSQAEAVVLVFRQSFVNSHSMTNPALHAASAVVNVSTTDPDTRGIASPVDLANGAYRMYVRARDTAGQWSPWSNRGWTQAVPVPATPTNLNVSVNNDTASVSLSVTAQTGGVATLVRFEYTDDGTTWQPVRTAAAVPLTATTTGTDRDPRPGVPRTYRAVAYSVDPRTASLPSSTRTATMTRLAYFLTAVNDPTLGGEIRAAGPSEWTRPVSAGVFEGLGAEYPTVVSDGTPKARRGTLHITAQDRQQFETVRKLAEADSVLLLRDPFGEAIYCRLVGDWSQRLLEAAPLAGENTPLRHMHAIDLPLVEVRPPHVAG